MMGHEQSVCAVGHADHAPLLITKAETAMKLSKKSYSTKESALRVALYSDLHLEHMPAAWAAFGIARPARVPAIHASVRCVRLVSPIYLHSREASREKNIHSRWSPPKEPPAHPQTKHRKSQHRQIVPFDDVLDGVIDLLQPQP